MLSSLKNSFLYTYYRSNLWKNSNISNKSKTAILMYHGITSESIQTWTQISTEDFEDQMQYICENRTPISLDSLITARIENQSVPDYAVCVTFDDGFKNNFTTAYPILKKYNIPATIFVTTSFIDKSGKYNGYLWTDYALMMLLETELKSFTDTDIGISDFKLNSDSDKIRLKEKIVSILKSYEHDDREIYLTKLKDKLNISEVRTNHPVFSGMTWQELAEIAEDPLITIGAHTINHPILSTIPETEIENEIIGSKKMLEQKLNKDINHFAYPNGRIKDYTPYAINIVKEHFYSSCSTIEGLSDIDDDLFQLKRISIGNDTTLWQFKLYLAGVYESLQKLKG